MRRAFAAVWRAERQPEQEGERGADSKSLQILQIPARPVAGTDSGFAKSAGIWHYHTQSFADIQDPSTFGPAIIGCYMYYIYLVLARFRPKN